jgi:hypothetical protein
MEQRDIEEVSRTLLKFGYTADQAENRLRRMHEAFPEAKVSFPSNLLNAVPDIPDQNDRHVVAAAIQSWLAASATRTVNVAGRIAGIVGRELDVDAGELGRLSRTA